MLKFFDCIYKTPFIRYNNVDLKPIYVIIGRRRFCVTEYRRR